MQRIMARTQRRQARPRRCLLYSHDSYGLGHLRRSISIAEALVQEDPGISIVLITGSPVPDHFALPERCEVLKIPAIGKCKDGHYVSRSMELSFEDLVRLRAALIAAATANFDPDVVLVDHTAEGPGNELLPMLRERREHKTAKVFLGIRDIIDAPVRVRAQFERKGTVQRMQRDYDAVLVYGDQRILDAGLAYSLPQALCERLEYMGIVCATCSSDLHAMSDLSSSLLASVGGGEDGAELLCALARVLRGPLGRHALEAEFVTGPLMNDADLGRVQASVAGDARIRLERSLTSLSGSVARAKVVVVMGGYNSIYEALQHGKQVIAMPRVHPRLEQFERCQRLQKLGLLRLIDPLDPQREEALRRALLASLEAARGALWKNVFPFDFEGARRVAQRLLASIPSDLHARHGSELCSESEPPDAAAGEFSPCA